MIETLQHSSDSAKNSPTHAPSLLLEQYKKDHWASHWGIRSLSLSTEQSILELPYKEIQLNQPNGVVHGGILASSMQDAALLLACEAYDIEPLQAELLDQQISYIGSTRDQTITISANFSRKARRFAFIHAEIKDQQDRLIAKSQLCFRINPDQQTMISSPAHYQAPSPLLLDGSDKHPMTEERFGKTLMQRCGLEITQLKPYITQLRMPFAERYKDFRGQISSGVILHMADTAGVLGPVISESKAKGGATVDFKMSFCEPTFDEALLTTSHCIIKSNGLMFSKIEVHGEKSQRLKAFGTQTFLLA
ncbi:hypothetical protein A9Q82_08905 [Cycloclasticus sp. 46_120_T64]|nr:hypothetical protein A9Q82_08905 [Cycloclasticus sp. 46_120_T64]